jgi:hypothetical protein
LPNSRHREDNGLMGISGLYQTFPPFPSQLVQSASVGVTKVCDDQVCAPREIRMPQTLLIVTKTRRLPTFSGRYPLVGSPIKQLANCPTDYQPAEPSPVTKYVPLTVLEQSNLAWQSLAATNPNVAHVSLPSYWAELKDLPALFRTWGDKQLKVADGLWKQLKQSTDSHDRAFYKTALRLADSLGKDGLTSTYSNFARLVRKSKLLPEIANARTANDSLMKLMEFAPKATLWYRWGWVPLISDIRRMWSFSDRVNERIVWLSRLASGQRVIKRRATLRNTTDYDSPTTVALKSIGANIQGRRTVVYTEKVWATVQWKLDPSFVLSGVGLEGDPIWDLAHRLTFGITTQEALSALWEIMPWSWFVDWIFSVQTIQNATKNTIPLTWGPICLMRHTTATALVEPLTSSADLSWCRPNGVHRQSEDRKQRLIVSPVLPFAPSSMPVFTTGQWSILGALAAVKSIGR